jgi:hypothetical protein
MRTGEIHVTHFVPPLTGQFRDTRAVPETVGALDPRPFPPRAINNAGLRSFLL